MLSIGNKKYRNLQEQVAYNTECIKKLDEYLDGITVEDKLVVISSDSGTFTDEELVILSGPLAFISNGDKVWIKVSETDSQFVYKAIDIEASEVGSAYFNIGGTKIVVDRESGAFNTSSDTIITIYSKSQIDSIVANIMAVKADKSEVTSDLALKANIAGQAFSGGITAPSIIEDMEGYSFINGTNPLETPYVSIVKNGNKLTMVIAGYFKKVGATNTLLIGSFSMPATIASKIVPFVYSWVDYKKLLLININNTSDIIEKAFYLNKHNSLPNFSLYLQSSNDIDVTKTYFMRYEATFLLSDSLAS